MHDFICLSACFLCLRAERVTQFLHVSLIKSDPVKDLSVLLLLAFTQKAAQVSKVTSYILFATQGNAVSRQRHCRLYSITFAAIHCGV